MQTLTLTRYLYDEKFGVFGNMWIDGLKLWTVERPWLNNLPNVSCIPEGQYQCSPRQFYRGGYKSIEIKNVRNRSYILFHIGNTIDDLEGCIAPGMYRGCLNGKWAVLNSSAAFQHLMTHYGGERFTLEIEREA